MYLTSRNLYTLLLLCAALAHPDPAATGDNLGDGTGAGPSVQDLDLQTSTRKPFESGFSPYPEFIDGHSPRHSVDQQQQLALQCSSEQQCSNTATPDNPEQVLPSQPAPASPEPHAAAQPTAEHQLPEPAAQQAGQQEQQLPGNAQHSAEQHAAGGSPQSPRASPPPAAGQETAHGVLLQESTAAAPPPVTPGDQKPAAATPPVRRLLNMALLSDGASVLAANPEAKRPERAIDKDIDSFMKNDCSAEKWMIIELSQLGTVETVKLTMKELYSSRVHTFRVFGRSSHPRKDGPDLTASIKSDAWQLLGRFTAENKRGTQSFSLPQRSRVRYILLMFDTHYGSEAMCALNMIEVLGVSAAQELEEALAMQEELEAEELFQHLQQQQEQEEQMHAQQQQQKQQQQQQPAAVGGGNGKAQAGTPSNETVVAQEEQQPASLAPPQHHPQRQQDSQVVAVAGSERLQDPRQQQVKQQTAAGADSSPPGNRQVTAQEDHTTQTAVRADAQGASSGSSKDEIMTEHPQESQLPVVKPAVTDQDVIAVPVADVITQRPGGSASDTDKSPITSPAVSQQHTPAADVPSGPSQASAGGISPMMTDGSAVSPAPGQQNGEQLISQQLQLQAPVQQAPSAAAAPTAAGPQAGVQQSVVGASQTAEQSGSISPSAGSAAAAAAAAAGALADAAVNGRVPSSASGEVAAASGSTSSGSGASATIPPQTAVSKQVEVHSLSAEQQQSVVQQPQVSPQQQQQQPLSSTGAIPQQQAHQRLQQPAREPALAGGSAKPKQAGNLFDIIKSEMMQLKLEQGKVSKKLEGLGRRGNEHEQLAAQLHLQQTQLLAQLQALSSRVGQLAEQVAQVQVAQQYNAHHNHQHHTTAGPPHSSSSAGGGRPHPHAMQGRGDVHVSPDISHIGPRHFSVCSNVAVTVPLLLNPRHQWLVVGMLAGSAVLGLLVLFFHPGGSKLSSSLRFGIGGLVLVNVVLALLLSMYILLLEGLFKSHQQARAYQHVIVYDTQLSVPALGMLGNGSM